MNGVTEKRELLLAVMERQRRPRVVPPSQWTWAKAWARRWWRVEATSADDARRRIALYEVALVANPTVTVDGRSRGILECGRNALGGPDRPPATHRKEPAVRPARA